VQGDHAKFGRASQASSTGLNLKARNANASPNSVHFEGNMDDGMNIEEDSDMYEDDGPEDPQDENLGIFCKQIMGVRPTTSTLNREHNDVPLKQLLVVEDSMPFPELFDRSERTFAATFARYGDLSYFTPV
jgi:hypothetical protein